MRNVCQNGSLIEKSGKYMCKLDKEHMITSEDMATEQLTDNMGFSVEGKT